MSLGKGLDSLIPQKPIKTNFSNEEINKIDDKNQVLEISIDKIQVNPHQPRKRFDHSELEDLTNSIKAYGIIQPLIVTKLDKGNYQLIAGERRIRSAQILNLKKVPVIIREAQEQQKLELALIENIQRKNLNALEEALSYKRLISEFNLKQEAIAKKIGKKRSTIANTLRLLNLPEEIQKAILDEKISEGHARAIAVLPTAKEQLEFLKKIMRNQMTVRQAESQAQKVKVNSHTRAVSTDPVLLEKEDNLRQFFGHKVVIKRKGKRGEIIIFYNSDDDLKQIYKKLIKS
ncbi:MAG: ParB/RepB/Spo0J family partition protein [Candidatus Buchananbacteria bacterium]|nr:ParB/RepB/Spo0J family partition protein [Candidatus Buchananbacteria bacterium]